MWSNRITIALDTSQISIGNEMGVDSAASTVISSEIVIINEDWYGNGPKENQANESSVTWMQNNDPAGHGHNMIQGNDQHALPDASYATYLFTTIELQTLIQYTAGQDQTDQGWEASRTYYSGLMSSLNQNQQTQLTPWNSLQQGQTTDIQTDQSAVSGSSQLGNILPDLDSIAANLVTNLF